MIIFGHLKELIFDNLFKLARRFNFTGDYIKVVPLQRGSRKKKELHDAMVELFDSETERSSGSSSYM